MLFRPAPLLALALCAAGPAAAQKNSRADPTEACDVFGAFTERQRLEACATVIAGGEFSDQQKGRAHAVRCVLTATIADCDRAIELDAGDPYGWAFRGDLRNAYVWTHVANAYFLSGDPDSAGPYYAAAIDPASTGHNLSVVQLYAADYFALVGRESEALAIYAAWLPNLDRETSFGGVPDEAVIRYVRGRALHAAGEIERGDALIVKAEGDVPDIAAEVERRVQKQRERQEELR